MRRHKNCQIAVIKEAKTARDQQTGNLPIVAVYFGIITGILKKSVVLFDSPLLFSDFGVLAVLAVPHNKYNISEA
jgi:hypothetical protein